MIIAVSLLQYYINHVLQTLKITHYVEKYIKKGLRTENFSTIYITLYTQDTFDRLFI